MGAIAQGSPAAHAVPSGWLAQGSAGKTAAITAVGALVAGVLPPPFAAVTTTRIVFPTSAKVSA